ncbi:pentapeptide repeat-containing protein [Fortiea contorta]|uniref:pentapeptide repeat-containing protein n=1 Tax=Fortiea contorta TaxID=1892405 RepID=UPI000345D5FA|nr:pentapeptide repeat-containing protein [Fortiea contorta]
MNTQRQEIIKLPKVVEATEATPLRSYVIRNIEILKSVIISIEITKEAIIPIILSLMIGAIAFFLLNWGNITNQFHEPSPQFTEFSGNHLELTANYHRQAILSDYLKTMTQTLLQDSPQQIRRKSAIFRAMTQSTLQELDPERQRYLIMFLQDVKLLQASSQREPSLLLGANLTGANLQGINLRYANLQGTNLSSVDLRGTDLRGANLANANLTNSCYDSMTFFDKNIQPHTLGMREVDISQKCS